MLFQGHADQGRRVSKKVPAAIHSLTVQRADRSPMRTHATLSISGLFSVFATIACSAADDAASPRLHADGGAAAADGGVTAQVGHPPIQAGKLAAAGDSAGDAMAEHVADAGVGLECPHAGKVGAVRVEFHCGSITTYTCKDLSNVVLEFSDGSRERFESQTGHDNTFTGTSANAGKQVVRVWVKAGANQSGDGPGYGERVEAPAQTCTPPKAGAGGTGEPCTPQPDGTCVTVPVAGTGGSGSPCVAQPDGTCLTPPVPGNHGSAGSASGGDQPG
jgi:hypothetical protein